jgi:uncharacterized membrane protein YsdA (DUF1294 family)
MRKLRSAAPFGGRFSGIVSSRIMTNSTKNKVPESSRASGLSAQHSLRTRKREYPNSSVGAAAVFSLVVLLTLPIAAIMAHIEELDWRFLFGVPLLVSVITFFTYRSDKLRARRGDWRIPESTLHTLELFGGWPGAFLAQRIYRHKTIKRSFQFAFWSIIVCHQLLAADSLIDWEYSTRLFKMILKTG